MATRDTSNQPPDFVLHTLLAQLVQPSLDQLSARIACLPRDCSVEQIHQSRILIRTLRAHLDTFDPLLKKRATKTAHKNLKWLDALLGPLRNTDVTAGLLASKLAPVLDTGSEATSFRLHLMHQLTEQREEQLQALLKQVTGKKASKLENDLTALVSSPLIRKKVGRLSAGDQFQLAIACLRSERKRLLRLSRRTRHNPTRSHLHRVRIQAKQVHYAYEAAQSQGVISDVGTITLSEQLHNLLGKHQDVAMVEAWLKDLDLADSSYLTVRNMWLQDLKQKRKKIRNKYGQLLKNAKA